MVLWGFAALALSLMFWVFAAICLKGCNHILISGYNMASKEEKEKFKTQYNVVAMNRYIGKMMVLPIAILLTTLSIYFLFSEILFELWLLGAFVGIAAFPVAVLCFYVAIKIISGDKFKYEYSVEDITKG